MSKLGPVSGAEVVAALARFGFVQVSQKGSHAKVKNAAGRTVIVPMHREVAQGTLRSILRQADVSPEDFAALL